MLNRRDFLQVAVATAAAVGPSGLARRAAAQEITQAELLRFDPLGQVTLLHLTDIHAQLVPIYFREPSINIGIGDARGKPPHLSGRQLLEHFGVTAGTPEAYALSSEDFVALARTYGKVGGLDRMATLVNAVRDARPDNTLVLDGGDTWHGSYTALQSRGADMVRAMNALGVDAMTGHWEFTLGDQRVLELIDSADSAFLAGNVFDTTWDEAVFDSTATFERGGVRIAVIGQAFPYVPVANPRWMVPDWSFGIREGEIRAKVEAARAGGAELVVLLSHNGFDVDRKLASRVDGIDVILTGHTHDAMPQAVQVGNTLLVASGSHGKFLSRLDLDVSNGRVADFRYRLIPVLADAIDPDPAMAGVIDEIRRPHAAELSRVLGRTDGLLYRRGNFNGTFDDLICQALLQERDADIAFSPGFRWGHTLLPGQDITVEDVYNHTAITYPNVYRLPFTGRRIKEVLEDVADNLFNLDPYYQQGGDMVRVGGLGYAIDVGKPMGQRISDLRLLRTGEPLGADTEYQVAGWASVNQGTEGPPIYDLVSAYIESQGTVEVPEAQHVVVHGAE